LVTGGSPDAQSRLQVEDPRPTLRACWGQRKICI
jgi:hypothetical protein